MIELLLATEIVLNWVAPTQNEDGSPAHPTGYRIFWNGPVSGQQAVGNVLTYTLPLSQPGTYAITMTTLDATGESRPTNPATATVTALPPVLSTIDTTVYKQTQAINSYTMKAIGTIALKTPCDPSHSVDGYNLLPDRTAVTYPPRAIMPTSVFAKCALQ